MGNPIVHFEIGGRDIDGNIIDLYKPPVKA